jgi:hypothetical protein
MARDSIVGTWVVTLLQGGVAKYKYNYTCSAPGTSGAGYVEWRDYWDASENGVGTWKRSGHQVNFDWKDSSTKEFLVIAPTVQGDKASGEVRASYGNFTTVAERVDIVDPKQDLMQQWAANYGDFQSPHICPWAIPYMLILPPNHKLYKSEQIGGPIQKVRGLAIHTTWSDPGYSEEATVGICIRTWNAAPVKTGAHFIIGRQGTLIQVTPTNRIAYAQGGTGDPSWLSVEIQTKESPANPQQIQSARILFQWVANTHKCDKKLAKGYIGAHSKAKGATWAASAKQDYDPITKSMCGAEVTTNLNEAVTSSGLSCHYWLNPVKPCPGKPLLKQMSEIAQGW